MKITLYEYPQCSTCRKAVAYLTNLAIEFQRIDIVKQPPNKVTLALMLQHLNGDLKKLFNTSGELYRAMNLKEKINTIDHQAALDLLAKHGKLIKRPFLITEKFGLVGFNQGDWDNLLNR